MARATVLIALVAFLTAFPSDAEIRVADDAGRTIILTAPARRIVSLYAAHSENVAALAGESKVVGISAADDPTLFPNAVPLPTRPSPEAILALAPDIVLVRPLVEGSTPGLTDTLEAGGIHVVSFAPPTWESMPVYLERLGALLGVDGRAAWNGVLGELSKNAVSRDLRPHIFLESTSRELRTCAPDSWAAHLIEIAGGENVAHDTVPLRKGSPLAACGVEGVLALSSRGLDVYLVAVGAMNRTTEGEVRARPWISALGKARIVLVPEEDISRPSLLRLAPAVKKLQEILFP